MENQNNETVVSRRNLIKGAAGIGGGLALASFSQLFGAKSASAGHDTQDSLQTIVTLAATAELLAQTAYTAALTLAQFSVEADDVAYLKAALLAEKAHYDFLGSLGGVPVTNRFYFPEGVLSNPAVFIRTFIAAEEAFVGAYLAATRRAAELGAPRIAATTAQHAASEAQHLSLIRDIGGLLPNDTAFLQPIYYNVSDALPTLAPFLNGGPGFFGPVTAPTASQVMAAASGITLTTSKVFTEVF